MRLERWSIERGRAVGLWIWLLVGAVLAGPARAEPRTALVIGNGQYPEAPLMNPVNDARDIAQALRDLGFEVIHRENLDKRRFSEVVSQFAQQLARRGGVGLFYYAGHGVQVRGQNYLIPVQASIRSEADVEFEAVDAGQVLRNMEQAANPVNIVILDACRDNPFRGWFRGRATRGLAQMEAPTGSIIAYATGPGMAADDGRGRNSPYTGQLLSAMRIPGLSIEEVFKRVRVELIKATGRRQVPWESSSLVGNFYFLPAQVDARPQPETPAVSMEPGQVFRDTLSDGTRGPEMVVIPAGEFQMGSPESEEGRGDDERLHRVRIEKPFAMGKYEVTFEEYDRFAEATGREKPDDRGWGRGRRPVINVGRDDAVAYAEWLSGQTGQSYRLPTEAEWEYAARAGTQTAYWWGDAIGQNKANCGRCGSRWDGQQTAPVGSFAANPFGLYDTAGNVWEWTCSEYDADYKGAEARCVNNDHPIASRVLRGGAWIFEPKWLRGAARIVRDPHTWYDFRGFRLARTLTL